LATGAGGQIKSAQCFLNLWRDHELERVPKPQVPILTPKILSHTPQTTGLQRWASTTPPRTGGSTGRCCSLLRMSRSIFQRLFSTQRRSCKSRTAASRFHSSSPKKVSAWIHLPSFVTALFHVLMPHLPSFVTSLSHGLMPSTSEGTLKAPSTLNPQPSTLNPTPYTPGIIPGVKPHLKAYNLPGNRPQETVMQGLDSLAVRAREYYQAGCRSGHIV